MVFNSLSKFDILNETDYELTKEIKYMRRLLKYALKKENILKSSFTVILVDNDYIHKLNKEYRNIDKETDVISFALCDNGKEEVNGITILGDIYISVDKAIMQSKEYNHSLLRELCFLEVHGFLHLLGFDHMNKKEEKIMFKEQELILSGKGFTSIQKKQKEF